MVRSFSFDKVPSSLADLQALPEMTLDDPFKGAALSALILCNYKNSPDTVFAMLDAIKGPQPLSVFEKQFIADRLGGKEYKPFSYFAGSSPENGYVPTYPLTIEISDGPYSYVEDNYAVLYLCSTGADSPRQVKMRRKPSEGKWYLLEIQFLSDIRIPAAEDPWA